MALDRKFLQSEVVLLCYKDIPIYVSLVKPSNLSLSYFLHEFRYTEVWDQEGSYVDQVQKKPSKFKDHIGGR